MSLQFLHIVFVIKKRRLTILKYIFRSTRVGKKKASVLSSTDTDVTKPLGRGNRKHKPNPLTTTGESKFRRAVSNPSITTTTIQHCNNSTVESTGRHISSTLLNQTSSLNLEVDLPNYASQLLQNVTTEHSLQGTSNNPIDMDNPTILRCKEDTVEHLNSKGIYHNLLIFKFSTCFAPTIQDVIQHPSESSVLNLILYNVIALKTMLDKQNEVLSEFRAGKVNMVTTEFDLVPKKPFVKFRKLLVFDEDLKSNENETAVFLLGGSHKKEQIKKDLKTFFSDKLATKYSWTVYISIYYAVVH
ncbi:hypothetical protein RN001_002011 [Aquatica leii]|uniref:Uncharacterized protein n=1 Tax=Aquatica leii TaxID=1421715 RepID=A0AAN7QAU0_9COLE|nr:hypothetical protein RN001_002011 [Aquatica leii]